MAKPQASGEMSIKTDPISGNAAIPAAKPNSGAWPMCCAAALSRDDKHFSVGPIFIKHIADASLSPSTETTARPRSSSAFSRDRGNV
jgi:hypothetical protein